MEKREPSYTLTFNKLVGQAFPPAGDFCRWSPNPEAVKTSSSGSTVVAHSSLECSRSWLSRWWETESPAAPPPLACRLFWTFVQLHWFVCPGLMPQGLYNGSFVECLHAGQTSPIALLFFLENDWAILDPLHFHSSYKIRLSRSTNIIFVV